MMNADEIESMIVKKIIRCYKELLFARSKHFSDIHIEGFRSRLDELLLIYHLMKDMTFIDACQELGIEYKYVNVATGGGVKK